MGCNAYCPALCNSNERHCPGSVVDGCKMQDSCTLMNTPNMNGDGECMGNCPVSCNSNEMRCSGSVVDGCAMEDTCQPLTKPSKNGDYECSAHCPVTCNSNETWCAGELDHNGCEQPAMCVPNTSSCPSV